MNHNASHRWIVQEIGLTSVAPQAPEHKALDSKGGATNPVSALLAPGATASAKTVHSEQTVRSPENQDLPAAMTIWQACHYSGLSRSFIYGLFDQKILPRLKAGKRVLILRQDLDNYLLTLRELAG
jgi:excisionase family DNA binding protein